MKRNSSIGNKQIDQINKVSSESNFKCEHPKLCELIDLANVCGCSFEYDLLDTNEVLVWYNNSLREAIRRYMTCGYGDRPILEEPFMAEFKDGDVRIITLRDYIISDIGEEPIEVAFCSPFIFRTKTVEYKMDSDFKIAQWSFSVSKYDKRLSNGKKYTDSLFDIVNNKNTRAELIDKYGVKESEIDELNGFLWHLFNSDKTDWHIIKVLQQSHYFMCTYCEWLLPYLLDEGKEEYMELVEILNS